MKQEVKDMLKRYSLQYETADFIKTDPIQFPCRQTTKHNQEIIGFVAAWLSYGNRKQFIPVIEKLYTEMTWGGKLSPLQFILEKRWKDMQVLPTDRLYRFYTYQDFFDLCAALHTVYTIYGSIERGVLSNPKSKQPTATRYIECLIDLFYEVKGIVKNTESACKRLNMFLRWMIRKNSDVDLGCWKNIYPRYLLIPLDTHAARIARQLGLITTKRNDMDAVLELTSNLRELSFNDPCAFDFALYGYGVNNPDK